VADTSDVVVTVPPRLDVVGLTSPEYDRVEIEVLQDWLAYWEGVAAGTEELTPWSGETIEMAPHETAKLASEIAARQAMAQLEPRAAQVPRTPPGASVPTQRTSTATPSTRGMSSGAKALLIAGAVVLGAVGLRSLSQGGSDIPISGSLAEPGPVKPDDSDPVEPLRTFPDGDYFVGLMAVGNIMPAGRYAATGGSNCHWERLDEVGKHLGAGVSTGGPVRVTVNNGEWFSTRKCGIWKRSRG
jgi:hypothetical protein